MSFSEAETRNHRHHHHHHAKHPNNDWVVSSYDSFQGSSFNNGFEYYYLVDPPLRNRASEYEREPVSIRVTDQKISSETVDAAAEEFIKLEHKKFEYKIF